MVTTPLPWVGRSPYLNILLLTSIVVDRHATQVNIGIKEYIMGNLFTKPLGVLIGMLYPAYQSFKALESPGIDDDKQWLTYWCVHSFLQVFEYFGEYILTGTIPFYYLVKLVFLVYLMHPQYRGALACYANFVAPYLKAHQNNIDDAIKKGTRRLSETADKAKDWVGQKSQDATKWARSEVAKSIAGSEKQPDA